MGQSTDRQAAATAAEACEIDWQRVHEDLLDRIMSVMPDSWDGDESAEYLAIEFVREISRRLVARGGSLDRHPGES